MFSVIFEVHPGPEQWDAYLGYAKMLRPELEQVDGFIDNIRYRSLTRDGWMLSLSGWRDEKALVRWRTTDATTTCRRRAAPKCCSTITCGWARSRRHAPARGPELARAAAGRDRDRRSAPPSP